jgi:hypothetical protein
MFAYLLILNLAQQMHAWYGGLNGFLLFTCSVIAFHFLFFGWSFKRSQVANDVCLLHSLRLSLI